MKVADYFAGPLIADAEFDFGEYSYVRGAKDLVLWFLERRRIPPAQRDFMFLTRVVLGQYEYFSRAKVKMNFRRFVAPYVRSGWQGRAFAIPRYAE
jgi:hypothetical protein